MGVEKKGWQKLLDGFPWFSGEGRFSLPAYSEFMPPPWLGLSPYGTPDPANPPERDPFGWNISEIEEEYELKPGMERLAHEVISALSTFGGATVHLISGHKAANLEGNPYWPSELARAGALPHERFVLLLPLALSRTQDDKGRVRWTLFGGSSLGPEKAFWMGFFTSPGREWDEGQSRSFICGLLQQAYGEKEAEPSGLPRMGFGILRMVDAARPGRSP